VEESLFWDLLWDEVDGRKTLILACGRNNGLWSKTEIDKVEIARCIIVFAAVKVVESGCKDIILVCVEDIRDILILCCVLRSGKDVALCVAESEINIEMDARDSDTEKGLDTCLDLGEAC
jgi:hypothetical protein